MPGLILLTFRKLKYACVSFLVAILCLVPNSYIHAQDNAVFEAQWQLTFLGYKTGLRDGWAGKRTVNAIRAFQRDQNIPETGALDTQTRNTLEQRADPVKVQQWRQLNFKDAETFQRYDNSPAALRDNRQAVTTPPTQQSVIVKPPEQTPPTQQPVAIKPPEQTPPTQQPVATTPPEQTPPTQQPVAIKPPEQTPPTQQSVIVKPPEQTPPAQQPVAITPPEQTPPTQQPVAIKPPELPAAVIMSIVKPKTPALDVSPSAASPTTANNSVNPPQQKLQYLIPITPASLAAAPPYITIGLIIFALIVALSLIWRFISPRKLAPPTPKEQQQHEADLTDRLQRLKIAPTIQDLPKLPAPNNPHNEQIDTSLPIKLIPIISNKIPTPSPKVATTSVDHNLLEPLDQEADHFLPDSSPQQTNVHNLADLHPPDLPVDHDPYWIPPGHHVTIQGRDITAGMIYVGPPPDDGYLNQPSCAFIDPQLPADRTGGDHQGRDMPFWPSYATISPRARATYLDWLAGKRDGTHYNVAYVMLYFYALERRFFLGNPTTSERRMIIAEAQRLLKIYERKYTIRNFLNRFLEYAQVVVHPHGAESPPFDNPDGKLPPMLRYRLSYMAATSIPLNADWLLSWLIHSPNYRLEIAVVRVFAEFRSLFAKLFHDQFPDDINITPANKQADDLYRAISGQFSVAIGDLIGSSSSIDDNDPALVHAAKIAKQAARELQDYSRLIGHNPKARASMGAHALLPRRLWGDFPCDDITIIRGWADRIIQAGGFVRTADIVRRLCGSASDPISPRELRETAEGLAPLGIGIVPDPRITTWPTQSDMPAILFNLPEKIDQLHDISPSCRDLQAILILGSMIAHADTQISDHERANLSHRIRTNTEISAAERALLNATLDWLLATPPDFNLLGQSLKLASSASREHFPHIALAVAAADGSIDPREITAVENLYQLLGLEVHDLDQHIKAYADQSLIQTPNHTPQDQTKTTAKESEKQNNTPKQQQHNLIDKVALSALMDEMFERKSSPSNNDNLIDLTAIPNDQHHFTPSNISDLNALAEPPYLNDPVPIHPDHKYRHSG